MDVSFGISVAFNSDPVFLFVCVCFFNKALDIPKLSMSNW